MRTGGFVVGLVAGVLALVAAVIVTAVQSSLGEPVEAALAAHGIALVGLLGAVFVRQRARLGATLMVIAGFALFFAIGAFGLVSLVLFLIAAGLSLFSPSPPPLQLTGALGNDKMV